MRLYFTNGQPIFHDVMTTAPDGTSRERYSYIIPGRSLTDAKIGSQSRWQEFFLRQSETFPGSSQLGTTIELPSLPTLVAMFLQIRKKLYSTNAKSREDTESLRDQLRADYINNNLPTSTNVSYVNHTITHRVRTSRAYTLPFYLPQQLLPENFPGFYEVKMLMERNGLERELMALFGHKDIKIVYEALKEVIGDEPFVVIYHSDMFELQESIASAAAGITSGEVRVGNSLRNPLWNARGVLLKEMPPNKGKKRLSKTPSLEKLLVS